MPATRVVDTLSDMPVAGKTTLREAVEQLRQLPGDHTITFAQNIQGGTITLVPANGAIQVVDPNAVGPEINIDGGPTGMTIQRDPNTLLRHGLFETGAGTTLHLVNLSLTGGASLMGGNVYAEGDLYLAGCTISGGNATLSGGGITFVGNFMSITNSTIAANSAGLQGGGIDIAGRIAVIANSEILCNGAKYGGGIWIQSTNQQFGSNVILDNVDVATNNAEEFGGGIAAGFTNSMGGATTLTLTGGTEVRENWCTAADPTKQRGGGIYVGKGTITFDGAWVGSNNAANGDGMYRANGTTKIVGPGGVTWYDDGEVVGP